MAIFGLSNKGRYIEHWQEAFALAAGITSAHVGRAVTLDTTAPKTVRLAAADDVVLGRLEVVENRDNEDLNVGTVSLKGLGWFPVANGSPAFTIGASIEGAGDGYVRPGAAPDIRDNFVQMIDATRGEFGEVFVIWQ